MNSFGCVRNTIKLISGGYFDLLNPRPEQFQLQDIAGALSKICRFGGQCPKFYSVAEHSVLCAHQAERDGCVKGVVLATLMHDAAEAFVGDMVKPLKVMLPQFDEIESRIESVIGKKYGIDFQGTKPVWKEIDRAMLIAERKALFAADGVKWTGEDGVRKLSADVRCLRPVDAETVPSEGLTLWQLRTAIQDLRSMGYTAHRHRDPNGDHSSNDVCVLIEREENAQ